MLFFIARTLSLRGVWAEERLRDEELMSMQLSSPRLVSGGWCVEVDGVAVAVATLNSEVLRSISLYGLQAVAL